MKRKKQKIESEVAWEERKKDRKKEEKEKGEKK